MDPIATLQCEVGVLKIILARVLGSQILAQTKTADEANSLADEMRIACIEDVGKAVIHTDRANLTGENIQKEMIDLIHQYFNGTKFTD